PWTRLECLGINSAAPVWPPHEGQRLAALVELYHGQCPLGSPCSGLLLGRPRSRQERPRQDRGQHRGYAVVAELPISGYAVPPPSAQPNYSSTYTIIQQPATTTSVVVVGGCPACRVGVLEDTFTCLGVLCAIVFFPIGILFCLALRQRRCPNCGAAFG
ncbi:brain protein I3, partial [Apteryx rowi]